MKPLLNKFIILKNKKIQYIIKIININIFGIYKRKDIDFNKNAV